MTRNAAAETHIRAALRYARSIAAGELVPTVPVGTSDVRAWLSRAPTFLSQDDLRDLEAQVVEDELARLAPSSHTFLSWRAAAHLVDLGGRPALSERAADTIDDLVEGADASHGARGRAG